jgi:hypothetical protein
VVVDRSISYLKLVFLACIGLLKGIIDVLLKTFTSGGVLWLWDVFNQLF